MTSRALGRAHPWCVRLVTAGAAVLVAFGLVETAAASAASPAHTSSATTSSTEPTSVWRGNHKPCQVRLPEPYGIVAYGTYYTCPPKRVLFIGDSVALTMGIETLIDEENWGTLVDDQAILGCGFLVGFEVNASGTFVQQSGACNHEFKTWQTEVERFKPQVIVVEMGWWDSMQHLRDGHVVQLGQGWYDAAVLGRMVAMVKVLAVAGSPRIDFMTVPWMDPPKFPDGQSQPAASAAFHDKINSLLAQAVAETQPRTKLFDVSPSLTPTGRFQFYADGGLCRESDGVHLYVETSGGVFVSTPCGRLLQKELLSQVREQLQKT